jgi:hypothetical protein
MTAERSNVLAFEPLPIGWLHLPLTQERAAAIVQFQERTGIELIPHLLDALDDIVFDVGEVALAGAVPCTEHTRGESERLEKSSAHSCRAMHDCAVLPSDEPAKDSGLTKPLRSSHRAQNAACELQPTNYPENANRPDDPSQQSSPRSVNGLCGND